MSYNDFKDTVLGQVIGDGQCVSLIVNNSNAYAEYLFPGLSWPNIISPIEGARQLLDAASSQYFQVIVNDHNDPNQLPAQGDVLVFDATPQPGYTNQFDNPYGHTGLCESTDGSGYTVLHQNSPYEGAPVNLKWYPWSYRPCLGWLHPVVQVAPPEPLPSPAETPPPSPTPVTPTDPPSGEGDIPLPDLVNNVPTPPVPQPEPTPSLPAPGDVVAPSTPPVVPDTLPTGSVPTRTWWRVLVDFLLRVLQLTKKGK